MPKLDNDNTFCRIGSVKFEQLPEERGVCKLDDRIVVTITVFRVKPSFLWQFLLARNFPHRTGTIGSYHTPRAEVCHT